jgi:hypothetical protein
MGPNRTFRLHRTEDAATVGGGGSPAWSGGRIRTVSRELAHAKKGLLEIVNDD